MATMNLTTVVTVENGNNGYPSSIKTAVVGFSSIEEAEAFAEKVEGEVEELHRRAGWNNWERMGWSASEFDMSNVWDEYSYIYFGSLLPTREQFLKDDVYPLIDGIDEEDAREAFMRTFDKMWAKIETLNPGDMIVFDDNYNMIYQGARYTMEYEYDSNYYCIGVVADEDAIEQEL